MPIDVDSKRIWANPLVVIGGLIILIDTLWGCLASLGLDLQRANEFLLAISFVCGVPMFLLDLYLKRRIAVCLIVLFLFRWYALCFSGPSPAFHNPFPLGLLLILAVVLLQLSKLLKSSPK